MKKRIVSALLAGFLLVSATACGKQPAADAAQPAADPTQAYLDTVNVDFGHSTREDMKNLIVSLSVKNPYVKASIIGAIKRNNINGWKDVAKHEKNNG